MTSYSKTNPFIASIKERSNLCHPGSGKNTQHLVLDLKNSGITYRVGDSIGIFPRHDTDLIRKTLEMISATGKEEIHDRHGNPHLLEHFLAEKANITDFSRKLLTEVHARQTHPEKKEHLQFLLQEENKEALKHYQQTHEIWQLLFENLEVHFEPQEFCNLLMPLLPRLYSISSSQKVVGEEVHLTVAMVEQQQTTGYVRKGVCTNFLSQMAPLNERMVPIYIQPSHGFTLPENPNTSLIMIGPGTGVAPFRAFMQERSHHHSTGNHWLFFGEWHRQHTFFYENFWLDLQAKNKLRLSTAFSRDQQQKVYVQHQMLEHGKELFEWLEQGAFLYVCGDAHRMAKDVESTLQQIVQLHGNKDESAARAYIKQLRVDKRYLRDVY